LYQKIIIKYFMHYSFYLIGTQCYEYSPICLIYYCSEWSVPRCSIASVFQFFLKKMSLGKIHEDQKELKLNGIHQLLFYIVGVNLKSESSCLVT